jgi:galactokinase
MTDAAHLINRIEAGEADGQFVDLYGCRPGTIARQTRRYLDLIKELAGTWPSQEAVESRGVSEGGVRLFSAPGRTEVGGNHTDHNAGRVLAAAVDLDIAAAVRKTAGGLIRVKSEGYPAFTIRADELARVDTERLTSAALVRGVCARIKELGYTVGGFDAVISGEVPKGSGLSSSAAFEVLIATILNNLYNGGAIPVISVAQLSQYSENVYFGKPCGLMDQTTCAAGGFVTIDFRDFANPIVRKINFDFAASGHTVVIVDTGGNHADLNEDYAAIEHEMKSVARAFGGRVLREFSKGKVLGNISYLRTAVNDRAILRALHFYDDDQRVVEQVEALESDRFGDFLDFVIRSGYSSWMLCQNCYSHKDIEKQEVPIALSISADILRGRGAWRVHGGGFAGTIQAFAPQDLLDRYLEAMRAVYGPNSCHQLLIRPIGSCELARQ